MPSPNTSIRKLAAIMFTDIAGYTALSAKDENKTLELLDKQKQLLSPIIEEFNGTLHKEVGDGLLLTFQTVTDAVKCGIKIQDQTKEVEGLNLRIGIHEGEITFRDGDALGEVIAINNYGSNDMLEVKAKEKKLLIPFVKNRIIFDIDKEKKVINVDWYDSY